MKFNERDYEGKQGLSNLFDDSSPSALDIVDKIPVEEVEIDSKQVSQDHFGDMFDDQNQDNELYFQNSKNIMDGSEMKDQLMEDEED